ncbi:type II toxin-antitoxin system VapC family toxin [Duganella radicis]|uniref:PIN domain-containing protein n=1 Tax=Duganella radicis TaxID=551988 RepID=A0A6L6PN60_9BURK|nr:type II toxin-antitoxin system VapC family toxin [Duganella radicis]MTV40566.1 PIN domain-containing protein [Duganella radicis]
MSLVLDASMTLSWIFKRADPAERACADRALLSMPGTPVVVPPLWYLEVANGLLVGERRRVVTEGESTHFLRLLAQLSISIDSALAATHHGEVITLARQHDLTAYDACYLELALRLGAALASFDGKLIKAAQAAGGLVFT